MFIVSDAGKLEAPLGAEYEISLLKELIEFWELS